VEHRERRAIHEVSRLVGACAREAKVRMKSDDLDLTAETEQLEQLARGLDEVELRLETGETVRVHQDRGLQLARRRLAQATELIREIVEQLGLPSRRRLDDSEHRGVTQVHGERTQALGEHELFDPAARELADRRLAHR